MPKSWIDQFNDNYFGRSAEGKSLEPLAKSNFKGNVYIPWAVMERMVYQQDPHAVFTKGSVDSNNNFSLLHTEKTTIRTEVKGEITVIESYAHFVVVSLMFLGRNFIEMYPIQDEKYQALKVYDQNMVNRALQRALAKVASRATGLGLSLYEKGELQFEEVAKVEAPVQPTPKKTIVQKTEQALKAMDEPVVSDALPVFTVEEDAEIVEPIPTPAISPAVSPAVDTGITMDTITAIVNLIKDPQYADKIKVALRSFNPSFLKTYGFTISMSNTEAEMRASLAQIADPERFLISLERNVK